MNRLIFTRNNNLITSFYQENDKIMGINLYDSNKDILGNVYVGVVDNIVKNIDAAFIRFDKINSGYISINENRTPMFLNNKNTDKYCIGDLVLVQVQKEAMKLKRPMLSTKIEISGQYCVVILGKKGVNVSSKISDKDKRDELLTILRRHTKMDRAIIARTNSKDATEQDLIEDITKCNKKVDDIIEKASHSKSGTCVYESEADYLTEIKNVRLDQIDQIVTDDSKLYQTMIEYSSKEKLGLEEFISFYQDDYSMNNLYGLDKSFEEAQKKRVWLKSGGFIVIEPTETLTAIDVNTGKAIKGKKPSMETFYNTNIEAADEIARQLRLRNISGIIIIDFIDLNEKGMKQKLMEYLNSLLQKDPVKAKVIDMTGLNLIEVTRMKIRVPLHEMIKSLKNDEKTLDEQEENS